MKQFNSNVIWLLLPFFCIFIACSDKDTKDPVPTSPYRILNETLATDQLGVGFRENDIALGLEIQTLFEELIADGTAKSISLKWFGEDILLTNQPFLKQSTALPDDNSLSALLERGKFIVGGLIYPPMFIWQGVDYSGFDIEIANGVAKKLGVELVIKPIIWDNKYNELNNGNIDCIWSATCITPERIDSMFFAKAYANNRVVIIVKQNSSIKNINHLEGKKVGVIKGSSHFGIVQSHPIYPKIQSLLEFSTSPDLIASLRTGVIDAMIIDEVLAKFYVNTIF